MTLNIMQKMQGKQGIKRIDKAYKSDYTFASQPPAEVRMIANVV
jgi:hypothetical protein